MHQRIYFFVYLQIWAVANLFSLDYFTLIRSRRPSTLLRPIAGLKETKIHLNYQEQQNK